MEFGTFYMAWKFPEIEKLFINKKEIAWFNNLQELKSGIKYYLKKEDEREYIAQTGQTKILTEYNTKEMVKMMFEIAMAGISYKYPWVEIYK